MLKSFTLLDPRRRPEGWTAALAFLVRLWFLNRLAASPFFEPISGGNDRALYDTLAQGIAAGHLFPPGVFEFMPLYPWLLGILYALFGPNLYVAGLVGAALDAATVFLIGRLARALGASPVASLLAAGWYALYPVAIAYSAVTMPNTLNAFLLILFAALATRMRDSFQNRSQETVKHEAWNRKRAPRLFLLGALAGVLTLGFAGMLLIFAAFLIFEGMTVGRRPKFAIQNSFLCLLGFVLPILPVTLHNWRAEHRFVLITAHGGFNFYMGNHPGATGYPVQIANFRGDAGSLLIDARAEAETRTGRHLTAAEFSQYWSDRAWTWIRAHPLDELRLVGSKFVKFWNRQEYDDLRLLPMLRLGGVAFTLPLWSGFGWMSWLALAGLFLARRAALPRMMTLAGIAGLLAFFVTARYRLTLAPLLAVFAALALSEIKSRCFSKHSSPEKDALQRGVAWGLLVFSATLAWAPLRGSDFRALDHYNTAAFLFQKGRMRDAENQARAGLALGSLPADLYFVMGNALFAQGRLPEACAAYETAIRLNPQRASFHYNLAVAHLKLGDAKGAVREAEIALKLDPAHSRAKKLRDEAASSGKD